MTAPRSRVPRLSIGLPVYNGEQYLREALDAILAQTFEDFELVISDNASTDGTAKICREYARRDKRIRYNRNEKNLGAAKNFSRVFELSRAPYFKWAAADDLMAPEFVARCMEALEREPRASLAYTRAKYIDGEGRVIEGVEQGRLRHVDWRRRPVNRFRQLLDGFGADNGCSAPMFFHGVIRSDVLRRTRLIGEYYAFDCVLLSELILLGEFSEVPEFLFFIRLHPGSSSWPGRSWESVREFHDPKARKYVSLPLLMLRQYLEYFTAVARSPLGTRDKASLFLYSTTPPFRRLRNKLGRKLAQVLGG